MKYLARTVAITYVAAEDRLLWTSKCADGQVVAAWIMRRHLLILLPRLAEWLERQSPVQQKAVAPAEARREIGQIEHRAAQQKLKAVRGYARRPTPDVEFLLNCFSVNLLGDDGVELSLLPIDNALQLSLPGTFAQLHKLVRELLDMANNAGWAVPDPWGERPPVVAAQATATRH